MPSTSANTGKPLSSSRYLDARGEIRTLTAQDFSSMWNGSSSKYTNFANITSNPTLKEALGPHFNPENIDFLLKNAWYREDPAGYVDGLNLYAAYFDVNGVDPDGLSSLTDLDDGWDMTLSLYNKYLPRAGGCWNSQNITSQRKTAFSDGQALSISKNVSRLRGHVNANNIYTTDSRLFMNVMENPVLSNAVSALEGKSTSSSGGRTFSQEEAFKAARDHVNSLFRRGKISYDQMKQILRSIPLSSAGSRPPFSFLTYLGYYPFFG